MEDTLRADVQAWIASQASYSDSIFSRLLGRDSLAARLERAYSNAPTLGTVARTPERIFLSRWLGAKPSLFVIDSGTRSERELISAATLSKVGNGAAMRAFVPSWDGRYVAIGTTERGDANAAISIVDASSGRLLADRIPDLLTTTSGTRYQVTWLPDGSGFFYPRLWPGSTSAPPADRLARGRQFLHRIGTPQSSDIPVFGFEVSSSAAVDKDDLPTRITTAPDSRWMVASVYRSKRSGSDWYAARYPAADGRSLDWTQIATVDDQVANPQLHGDTIYALSRLDADRGRVVRRVLTTSTDKHEWETILPERAGVITSFTVQGDALYATERSGEAIVLLRQPHGSKTASIVRLPLAGTINLYRGHTGMHGVLASVESWATPPEWLRVDGQNVENLNLNAMDGARQTGSIVAERIEAKSKDGTLVPVSLVYSDAALRNGKLDGTAPLFVEAYGGFGSSNDPSYNPGLKVWVDLGGVYAYAHARGGGELGDAWHTAAMRENKQRTIDDVIGVVEALITKRYTSAGRVALMGISFGANIPGLAMLQRPELFGVALFEVGQPDEIRGARLDPTAARNIAEVGDLDSPEGVRLLKQASPYHRVPNRIELPAVIVHSSRDDYNFGTEILAGKYVARLQAANTGSRPVMWVRTPGGHVPLVAMAPPVAASVFSFILWQTRHPDYQP
jgi:prolyl oligopeptidase